MYEFKSNMTQMIALLAIVVINSILLYMFFYFVLLHNIRDLMVWKFNLSFSIFAMLSFYAFTSNLRIPYIDIGPDDNIEEALKHEMSMINVHLFVSCVIVTALSVSMYINELITK